MKRDFKPRLRPLQITDDGSAMRLAIAKGDREHVFMLEREQAIALRDEMISALAAAALKTLAAPGTGKKLSAPAPVISATAGAIAVKVKAPDSETWSLEFHNSKGPAVNVLLDGPKARRMARDILGIGAPSPEPAQNDG